MFKNEGLFTEWKVKKVEDVSEGLVNSYFRPLKEDLKTKDVEEFEGKLKENCLYPVKDYYREYPDGFRFYLNEENLRDVYLRES